MPWLADSNIFDIVSVICKVQHMPAVNKLNVSRKVSAAMQPLATCTVASCLPVVYCLLSPVV